jgi:hypothetical protein
MLRQSLDAPSRPIYDCRQLELVNLVLFNAFCQLSAEPRGNVAHISFLLCQHGRKARPQAVNDARAAKCSKRARGHGLGSLFVDSSFTQEQAT